jgi:hypothetical protein
MVRREVSMEDGKWINFVQKGSIARAYKYGMNHQVSYNSEEHDE